MTKTQLFAAVGGIGDDLVTRPTVPAAPARPRKSRRPLAIAASVAACLLLTLAAVIYVQIDLNYFVASCAGTPGTIVDGLYYFKDVNSGIYVYDPATGKSELVISELFHDLDGARINSYGVYYRTADRRNLTVRVHATGETKTLYKSSSGWTHTSISELYEDTVLFTLHNKEQSTRHVLLLDAQTGEVLDSSGAIAFSVPYPVGDRNIAKQNESGSSLRYLTEDGEPILVDDYKLNVGDVYSHNLYAGDSLIAYYWRGDGSRQFVLLRPSGENLKIEHDFEVVAGTNDYLFGHLPTGLTTHTASPLYAYSIATGETFILISDYQMQELTTDGTYLYATAPWSSHTDVYRLDYAEGGTLTGVTLIDTIGE